MCDDDELSFLLIVVLLQLDHYEGYGRSLGICAVGFSLGLKYRFVVDVQPVTGCLGGVKM